MNEMEGIIAAFLLMFVVFALLALLGAMLVKIVETVSFVYKKLIGEEEK